MFGFALCRFLTTFLSRPTSFRRYDGTDKLHKGDDDDDDDAVSVSSSEPEADPVLSYDVALLRSFFKPGFSHAVVAFAVSAIVINTASTYMEVLLEARGHGRNYTGAVGFFFQMTVMGSSFVVGSYTDRNRTYYGVVLTLLVGGVVTLLICARALSDR